MNNVNSKCEIDLNKVLSEYAQTKDASLITDEVYSAMIGYTIHIAKPFMVNNHKYRDYDEVMSICNVAIMSALESYDGSKSKISTFIATCIRNAILMDMRKEKKQSRCARYLEEVVAYNIRDNSELTLGELIEDVKASDFTNYDSDVEMVKSINEAITLLKEKNKLNDKMYKVTIDYYMSGKTQKEISKEMGISQSYVSRLLKNSIDVIIKWMERNDISATHRPAVRKG